MILLQILISGILGTVLMTLFSHLCSILTSEEYSEPKLLNRLLRRSSLFSSAPSDNDFKGWLIHFGIGIVMACWLWFMYHFSGCGNSLIIGAFLGFLAGLAGVIAWFFLFQMHHDPPKINLKGFVVQLVVAHLIFGWVVYGILNLWNS